MERRDHIDKAISAIDRALDVGRQDTNDLAPTGRSQGCVRCGAADLPEHGEMCLPCRAYMLGDTDVDPVLTARKSDRLRAHGILAEAAARAEESGDELGGLLGRFLEQNLDGGSLLEKLKDGELWLLVESGETVTGPEAVDMIRAAVGLSE